MTILLVLLGLLFILIILRLLLVTTEGFTNGNGVNATTNGNGVNATTNSISQETTKAYNNFLQFYNTFCANWQKAITSSVASELPQQPLTDPSQVNSSTAPNIPTSQLNMYITQLEQQISQPLPQMCSDLPTTLDSTTISKVIPLLPTDPQPYINALNWMNQQMSASHQNLGAVLNGGNTSNENFEDMCQDVSQCIANNPQLAQEIAQQITQQNQQNIQQQEQQLMALINPFLTNDTLNTANELNQQLVQTSQDIQNKAQSGELVNQINVPEGTPVLPIVKPANSDTLSQMANSNPQRYNELKQNYGPMFSLKQTLESINAAL